jgi:hypothetical protein
MAGRGIGFDFMNLDSRKRDPRIKQETIDELRYKYKIDFWEPKKLTKEVVDLKIKENNERFTRFDQDPDKIINGEFKLSPRE